MGESVARPRTGINHRLVINFRGESCVATKSGAAKTIDHIDGAATAVRSRRGGRETGSGWTDDGDGSRLRAGSEGVESIFLSFSGREVRFKERAGTRRGVARGQRSLVCRARVRMLFVLDTRGSTPSTPTGNQPPPLETVPFGGGAPPNARDTKVSETRSPSLLRGNI